MNGITTIFDHKKWVFAYVLLAVLVWLLKTGSIDGGQFVALLLPLATFTLGASSFDKSVWRKNDSSDT